MRLILAFKAFFKAFKDPDQAKKFVESCALEGKETKRVQETKPKEKSEFSHLRLLGLLQHSSRLVDFLKEDLSYFDDGQVGAAVRKIHEDCGKCLEDLVTIRPLMEEQEGSSITIPKGYDPAKIKVVGKIKGEPPYIGILVHKGWKAHKQSLPKESSGLLSEIICPAEIEVR